MMLPFWSGVRWKVDSSEVGSGSVLGEEGVEPINARAPQLLELVKQPLRTPDGLRVAADESFAATAMLRHQPGPFQNGHVLLHRGERHRIGLGQPRHRCFADEGPSHDVSAGGIRERVEDPVDLRVTELLHIYNHLVVG